MNFMSVDEFSQQVEEVAALMGGCGFHGVERNTPESGDITLFFTRHVMALDQEDSPERKQHAVNVLAEGDDYLLHASSKHDREEDHLSHMVVVQENELTKELAFHCCRIAAESFAKREAP